MRNSQYAGGDLARWFSVRGVASVMLAACLVSAGSAAGSTERTWNGPANGDWFDPGNWSGSGNYPQAGDTVIVNSGSVLLTNATAALSSFTLGAGASITFSNWTTRLEANTISISGTVNVASAFTEAQMSNRVHFAGTTFTLHDGGVINADAKGYANTNGLGKGASTDGWGGGGGHGGRGGHAGFTGGAQRSAGGSVYGAADAPLTPGSGGGVSSGGFGGGAVRIDMTGTVTINGLISANGGDGVTLGGGGSGGSVYITSGTFGGNTNGLIQANGGNGNPHGTAPSHTGGGGGGRIAVHYTSLSASPGVRFSARRAERSFLVVDEYHPEPLDRLAPESGTLHFSDTALLDNVISTWNQAVVGMAGSVHFASTNQWTLGATTWSNSQFTVPSGSAWTVPGGLTLSTGSVSVAAGAEFSVTGGLTLTNGATLVVYAAPTNGTTAYGNLIDIGGVFSVGPGSWVYPFSHSTNGGSVLFRVGSLTVHSGGGFNADGRGYARNTGQGKGTQNSGYGGGGGYGGQGGRGIWSSSGFAERGSAYGDAYFPLKPGSGGGHSDSYPRGGAGGGLIWVEADGAIQVDGLIRANGGRGSRMAGGNSPAGGGSGGGIFLAGSAFSGGASGAIQADGENGGYWSTTSGGGGGGGGLSPSRSDWTAINWRI